MSLCPCNVGLHKPVSGPLHEADLGYLQSKGIEPLFPSSTPPSPGLRVPSPPDCSLTPTQSLLLDRCMGNMETDVQPC